MNLLLENEPLELFLECLESEIESQRFQRYYSNDEIFINKSIEYTQEIYELLNQINKELISEK